jgi:hypothetical protein
MPYLHFCTIQIRLICQVSHTLFICWQKVRFPSFFTGLKSGISVLFFFSWYLCEKKWGLCNFLIKWICFNYRQVIFQTVITLLLYSKYVQNKARSTVSIKDLCKSLWLTRENSSSERKMCPLPEINHGLPCDWTWGCVVRSQWLNWQSCGMISTIIPMKYYAAFNFETNHKAFTCHVFLVLFYWLMKWQDVFVPVSSVTNHALLR